MGRPIKEISKDRKLNLNTVMEDRGISMASISRKSGLEYHTLRDKIKCRTAFKVDEAMKVYRTYFTEFDFTWLFKEIN